MMIALALEVSRRRLMILSNSPGLGSLGIFKDWAIHTPPERKRERRRKAENLISPFYQKFAFFFHFVFLTDILDWVIYSCENCPELCCKHLVTRLKMLLNKCITSTSSTASEIQERSKIENVLGLVKGIQVPGSRTGAMMEIRLCNKEGKR